jgi:hypothetical protein
MNKSPIEELLEAVDTLNAKAAVALFLPQARVLTVDGHRAEGSSAVGELLKVFFARLRSSAHRITAQWHLENVWIAEVEASYELRDWLQMNALPRAFVLRTEQGEIADLRIYGANEQPLTDHRTGEEGMWVGTRWIPPL